MEITKINSRNNSIDLDRRTLVSTDGFSYIVIGDFTTVFFLTYYTGKPLKYDKCWLEPEEMFSHYSIEAQ